MFINDDQQCILEEGDYAHKCFVSDISTIRDLGFNFMGFRFYELAFNCRI